MHILLWLRAGTKALPPSASEAHTFLLLTVLSDTTAATLTNMFFHLALDQKLASQVQESLDQLPDLANDKLDSIDLLDAIINETLRLHPPTPSGLQRITPTEGLNIGEIYVPGNVIVQVPLHTVFRGVSLGATSGMMLMASFYWKVTDPQVDKRVFELPNDFIPQRWTKRRELIKDESVFVPFSTGELIPYQTWGKTPLIQF
jgi:cytochrome P450